MGDRGLPRTWRHMNGYSSHTYMWINAGGERFWVKYHFKTDQGVEHLTQDEAAALAAADPDFHLRDLYEAIGSGDHPSWTLFMQVMPFDDAAGYRFNPFDLTKVWPHGDYPLIKVGRMVLDRNPENYFAEIEQAAFEPSNMVPGIGPSPDKMLLGRLFSYHDTHLHRIGPNAMQLPGQRPRVAPCTPTTATAPCATTTRPTRSTRPNSYGGPAAAPERFGADPRGPSRGDRPGRLRAAQEDDDFGQAEHHGPRRARRRRPGPAGRQHRRPRARRGRRARARACEGVLAPRRPRPGGADRQGARKLTPAPVGSSRRTTVWRRTASGRGWGPRCSGQSSVRGSHDVRLSRPPAASRSPVSESTVRRSLGEGWPVDRSTTMKGRTVNFFIEPEALPDVLRAIDEDVLPRYPGVPALRRCGGPAVTRGTRIEVAGISLWDGELEDSEEIAAEFRREVHRVAGTGAARTAYEVIRLELRDRPGSGPD